MVLTAAIPLLIVLQLFTDDAALSDMNDLGNLMLGGFVFAVGLAIAITFIRLKRSEKHPAPSQFISINSREDSGDN